MGGTWKVRSLYTSESLVTSARELSNYTLRLVEYRSDGTRVVLNQQKLYCYLWKREKYHELEMEFLHTTITQAVTTVVSW
jgi:hypothetical protein